MMLLCIPTCEDGPHQSACLDSILKTSDVEVTLFDNSSKNIGFYAPLGDVYRRAVKEGIPYVGLCHNDVIFYEKGWDRRIREAFEADLKLGLVGLCGSDEADQAGGRGGGTMCFFRGERGQSQDAGLRIHDLRPAVLLDSLFMMFRTAAVPALREDWNYVTLAHFYDKIWPLRLYEMGWRTAVLGSEIDHIGSQTIGSGEDGNIPAAEAYKKSCKQWFNERQEHIAEVCHKDHGIDYELAMYLIAEQRFLNEYREQKKLIPCKIDGNYRIHKG